MSDSTLKKMILDAPLQSESITSSVDSIDDNISELQEKQTSLQNICNSVASDLESYLIGEKFTPEEDYYMYQYGDYNEALVFDGNLTEWKIYKNLYFDILELVSATGKEIILEGNLSQIFSIDQDLSFVTSVERVYSLIENVTYDAGENETTITLVDSVLTGTLLEIWDFEYSFLDSDDQQIDDLKDSWDFSHDYIVQPLGTSGTYGIKANIDQLTSAKGLLNANKNKITQSVEKLTPFL